MISRLIVPFKDIFTTIFTVETEEGVLIFDTGTYPEDITRHLLPFLAEKKIPADAIRAVFISHSHGDHAGGLATLAPLVPNAVIYTRSEKLKEEFEVRHIKLKEVKYEDIEKTAEFLIEKIITPQLNK